MDGVLVVDKPEGLTSHDVVAVARRAFGGTRIGHTGTLDPLATGVLPLACGRATRLVRFLGASEKDYDAAIRFGITTDSYDVTGQETSRSNATPSRADVLRALDGLKGEYLQTPPAFSAKRVGGRRAYDLARGNQTVALTAVPVRVTRADLTDFADGLASVAITCSAGFYVRSFAHMLGETVATGACLETLRRTRSGDFTLDDAVTMDELSGGSSLVEPALADAVIPLEKLLTAFPSATLNDEGLMRVTHGRALESAHYAAGPQGLPHIEQGQTDVRRAGAAAPPLWIRVFDPEGRLVAVAQPAAAAGSLHPAIVLI